MDSTQSEKAEIDYMAGMKYKEIADKYNVSINTVKSWKTRCNWNKKGAKGAPIKEKKVCTPNNKKSTQKEVVAEEIKEVLANTKLNDKQRLFCVIYSRCLNATKAYQEVYKAGNDATARVNSSKLLIKTNISDYMKDQRQKLDIKNILTREYKLQKLKDIIEDPENQNMIIASIKVANLMQGHNEPVQLEDVSKKNNGIEVIVQSQEQKDSIEAMLKKARKN